MAALASRAVDGSSGDMQSIHRGDDDPAGAHLELGILVCWLLSLEGPAQAQVDAWHGSFGQANAKSLQFRVETFCLRLSLSINNSSTQEDGVLEEV